MEPDWVLWAWIFQSEASFRLRAGICGDELGAFSENMTRNEGHQAVLPEETTGFCTDYVYLLRVVSLLVFRVVSSVAPVPSVSAVSRVVSHVLFSSLRLMLVSCLVFQTCCVESSLEGISGCKLRDMSFVPQAVCAQCGVNNSNIRWEYKRTLWVEIILLAMPRCVHAYAAQARASSSLRIPGQNRAPA